MVILLMNKSRDGGSNMKKVAIYSLSFLSLVLLLSITYFLSYRYALRQFNDNATRQDAGTAQLLEDVTTKAKMTISMNADYVVQTYDMATKELKTKKEHIPNDWIGLTRNQVVARINQYMLNRSLQDYQAGLVSFTLETFSPDKVTVKKVYNSEGVLYDYYLVVQDNTVVVYYSDKKTVYDYTQINADDLSEEDRKELLYGKWVKDEDELCSVLESMTS